jgi:hypothetical protein
VAKLLVAAGAKVDPKWLESKAVLANPTMLQALRSNH